MNLHTFLIRYLPINIQTKLYSHYLRYNINFYKNISLYYQNVQRFIYLSPNTTQTYYNKKKKIQFL